MKQKLLIICFALTFNINAQTAGNGVTDVDGNFYSSVIIGTQEWTNLNFKSTKYKNGENITINPTVNTSGYYNYNNNSIIADEGRLYNWRAVDDTRGLAPEGWHIPTVTEWNTLLQYTNSYPDPTTTFNETIFLKKPTFWSCNSNLVANAYNFNAIPTNIYDSGTQSFAQLYGTTLFWTSTFTNGANWTDRACSLGVYCDNILLSNPNDPGSGSNKNAGFSVRLIKNSPLSTSSFSKLKMSFYPNPVKSEFILNTTETIITVEIYDILGKVIFSKNSSQTNVNIEFLKKGIYLLKVKTENGTFNSKIIKE